MASQVVLELLIQLRDEASAQLGGIQTQMRSVGSAAQSADGQSQGFFSTLLSQGANIGGLVTTFGALKDSVIGLGLGLVAGNVEFEGYEARFATLLGSADAAKQKIADLSKFAATTPFDLPGVVQAATSMRTLGGVSFDTSENLKLIGNAAAAAGQPVNDVSFWISRAYGAIQSGQPFGEAAARLQEMGIFSGDARTKVEALQKSGAQGPAVWEAFASSLNAPKDAMDKLGQTWGGLSSTLEDSWAGIMRTFGQPLFDELKPQLNGIITALNDPALLGAVQQLGQAFAAILGPAIQFIANEVIPGVVSAFTTIAPILSEVGGAVGAVADVFIGIANDAVAWGSNIITSLADGMMAAAGPVVDALSSIGSVITSWLQPGSPPKLLPELTNWGQGAAAAYMDGWDKADFTSFNGITDAVKSALDGVAKATGDKKMNVAEMVLGTQDEIAAAVQQVHQFGTVSEDAIQAIVTAAGPAGESIGGVVRAYLDLEVAGQNVQRAQEDVERATQAVTAAQDNLNAVSKEYDERIAPLKDRLDATNRQKQALQDQVRVEKIRQELAKGGLSDAERQIKLLEIKEIQQKADIRAVEDQKAAAEAAAKANVDAAKSEQEAAKGRLDGAKQAQDAAKDALESQKAHLDTVNKGNALIGEQVKAMEAAAKAMHKAAGAMKAKTDADKQAPAPIQAIQNAMKKADDATQATATAVQQAGYAVHQFLDPAITLVKNNIDAFKGAVVGVVAALAGWFAAFTVWPALLGGITAVLGAVGTALAFLISPLGLLIIAAAAVGAAFNSNFLGFRDLVISVFDAVVSGVNEVVAFFGQLAQAFSVGAEGAGGFAGGLSNMLYSLGTVSPLFITLGDAVNATASYLEVMVPLVLNAALAFISLVSGTGGVMQFADALAAVFGPGMVPFVLATVDAIRLAVTVFTDLAATAQAVAAALSAGDLAGAWAALSSGLAQVGADLLAFGAQLGGILLGIGQVILDAVLQWGAAFIAWIGPMIPPALAALGQFIVAVGGWAAGQIGTLAGLLLQWGQAFIAWIAPMIPPALAALGQFISGVAGWAASQVGALGAQLLVWGEAFIAWIAPMIPPALAALGGLVTQILSWAGSQIGALASAFGAWAGSVIGWVVPMIPQFLAQWPGMLSGFLDWIAGAVGPILASFGAWALAIVDWVIAQTPVFAAQLGQWVGAFLAWVLPMIPPLLLALAGVALSIITFIVETAVVLAAKLIAWGLAFIGWIGTEVLPKLPALLLSIAEAILTFIGSTVARLAQGIGLWAAAFVTWIASDVLPKLPKLLQGIADTVWSFITDTAKEAVDKAGQIGEAIVQGIEQGIERLVSGLVDKAKQMVKDAYEAARSALDINSPSRLFASGVGDPMVEGVVLGMQRSTPLAQNAAQSVSRATLVAMQPNAADANTVGGNTTKLYAQGVMNSIGTAQIAGENLAVATGNGAILKSRDVGIAVGTSVMIETANGINQAATTVGPQIGAAMGGVMTRAALEAKAAMGALSAATTGGNGGIIPPLTQAFVSLMQRSLEILQVIAKTVNPKMVEAAKGFAEGMGKVIELMDKAVTFFARLHGIDSIAAIAGNPFQVLGNNLLLMYAWMAMTLPSDLDARVDVVMHYVEGLDKILDVLAKAQAFFIQLNQQLNYIPAVEGNIFSRFTANLLLMYAWFNVNYPTDPGPGMDAVIKYVESLGKILDVMQTAQEVFQALNRIEIPPPSSLIALANAIGAVFIQFISIAQLFSNVGLDMVAQFAASAKELMDLIGTGVDALNKIRDYAGAVPVQAISDFIGSITIIIGMIAFMTRDFTPTVMAQAATFAESAKTITDLIGTGVEQLSKMADYTAPPTSAFIALDADLRKVIAIVIGMANDFGRAAAEAGAAFADSASKMVSLVGAGVDGLTKLADFVAPSVEAVAAFGATLVTVVGMLIIVAQQFDLKATQAAGAFSESASKMVSLIGAGVDGMVKLADFVAPSQEAVAAFGQGLILAVNELIRISNLFSADAVAAAAAFSETTVKVLSLIGTGVDALAKLDSFAGLHQKPLDYFTAGLMAVLIRLQQLAAIFALDGLQAAADFTAAVGAVLSSIGGAVEALNKIDTVKAVDTNAMNTLSTSIQIVIFGLQSVARVLQAGAIELAGTFVQAAQQVLAAVVTAIATLNAIDTVKPVTTDTVNGISSSLQILVFGLISAANTITPAVVQAAVTFAQNATLVIQAVADTIAAFSQLAVLKGDASAIVSGLITALAAVAAQVQTVTLPIMSNLGAVMIQGILTGIGTGLNLIGPVLSGAFGAAYVALMTLPGTMAILGFNMMAGLASGIISGVGMVAQALVNAVQAAVLAARAALGIASPSKVMAQMVGLPAGQGIAAGMDAAQAQVQDASAGLATTAVSAAAGAATPGLSTSAAAAAGGGVSFVFESGAVQITQQPGESADGLVDRVAEALYAKMRDRLV